jgi:hypothetical protein
VTSARVLTFHIDGDERPGLSDALDGVTELFAGQSDFRGLVCLEHDSTRNEIMVITLWDGEGMRETQEGSELARRRIAATTDLGVSSKCYHVLRIVPGTAALEDVLAEVLSS